MARYKITEEDLRYAAEFLKVPVGYHSPGLQRVLNLMRGPGWNFKYVLIVEERHGRWRLGRLPAMRGAPIVAVEGVEYSDLIEAERDVFRRRWHDLTGQNLDVQLEAAGLS